MIYFVIPAREGSKGLPGKNRILYDYTASIIPDDLKSKTIVVTDDLDIVERSKHFRIMWHEMGDESNMRDVLIDAAREFEMAANDIIVMLYVTYPERKFSDVAGAMEYFVSKGASSLLCRKSVKTHPYLCIYSDGHQVVNHDYYRRQDYPPCYEISHFVSIVRVGELPNLRRNLYNDDTIYIDIYDVADIDTQEDLQKCESVFLPR